MLYKSPCPLASLPTSGRGVWYVHKVLILIVLAASLAFSRYSPNIRVDNDINEFVRRIAARYNLALPPSFYFQPMPAAELIEFLEKADSLNASGLLTSQEKLRLKRLRAIAGGKPNILTLKKPEYEVENHVNFAFFGEANPSYDDSAAAYMRGVLKPELTGCVGKLSYFSGIDVWTELQTDTTWHQSNYEPYMGVPYNLFGRADSAQNPAIRSSDMLRAGVSLSLKRIDLSTAIDYMRTGPAVHTPLNFSGQAPPLTYFKARIDMAAMQYFHTFGLLRCQKDKDKYFYAHRLEIPIGRWRTVIGINEAIISGSTTDKAQTDPLDSAKYGEERNWEWIYMIPYVPYSFGEHYVGDKDNSLLSFDVALMAPAGFRWYVEFLLDDITTPVTIFSEDWGNKWALTVGGEYFGSILRKDFHASLEYSRVEPWVYTHFFGGSTRYTHFGQSLGAPLGPNSAVLVFISDIALNARHTAGIMLKNMRTNRSARGGSITDVFQRGVDSEVKEFLGDGTESENIAALFWKMTPFGMFALDASIYYDTDGEVGLQAQGRFLF